MKYSDNQDLLKRETPSAFWNELSNVIKIYFHDEIIDSKENLELLYCTARPRLYDDTFIPSNLLSVSPQEILDYEVNNSEPFNLTKISDVFRTKPLIILSPIGRGKSTFVHYVFKIEFPKKLNINTFEPIFVDIRNGFFTNVNEFKETLTTHTFNFIKLKYKEFSPKNNDDLDSYKSLLFELYEDVLLEMCLPIGDFKTKQDEKLAVINEHKKNKVDYLKRIFNYIKKQYLRNIVLIIDNLDQCVKFYQEQVFIDANSFSSSIGANLILTLRDTSFNMSNSSTALSAYTPKYLNLSLPSIKELLKVRLEALRKEFSIEPNNEKVESDGKSSKLYNIDIIKAGNDIIDLFLDENNSLIDLISNISNYNLRLILEQLHIIFSSYHSFASTYGKDINMRYSELIPKAPKIILALMLGNNQYYNDTSNTHILNLFKGSSDDDMKYFFRLRLLQLIYNKDNGISYKTIKDIFMRIIHYSEDRLIRTLIKFYKKGLIIVSPVFDNDDELSKTNAFYNKFINITYSGKYHIENIIYNDTYIDEIKYITELKKEEFNNVFFKGFESAQRRRMASTLKFIGILNKYEDIEFKQYTTKQLSYFKKVTYKIRDQYSRRIPYAR